MQLTIKCDNNYVNDKWQNIYKIEKKELKPILYKQTVCFHLGKIICLDRFLLALLCFFSIL